MLLVWRGGGKGIWAFLEKKNSTQCGSFIRIKKKRKKNLNLFRQDQAFSLSPTSWLFGLSFKLHDHMDQ
jgi:hypothetical protein